MSRLIYIILIFCVAITHQSFTQSPYFTKYMEKDGLSSNHIYKVIQDSKGYIWMVTLDGVSRYDGDQFERFGTDDGLTDYDIIGIFEDSENRIWFATFNGLPCYFKDDEIYNHENHELLRSTQLGDYIKHIYEDSDNNIWIASGKRTVKIDFNRSKVSKYDVPSTFLNENKSREIIAHHRFDRHTNLNSLPHKAESVPLGKNTFKNPKESLFAFKILQSKNVLFSNISELFLKSYENDTIYKLEDNLHFGKLENVRNIAQDDKGNIYLATTSGAYICSLDEINKSLSCDKFPSPIENLTSFTIDHQKGYWISSKSGLYHFKNKGLQILNPSIKAVDLLAINKDRLVIAEPDNKISILDINTYEVLNSFYTPRETKLIKNINDDLYIITDYQIYKVEEDNFRELHLIVSAKDMEIIKDQYILASHSGVFVINNEVVENETLRNKNLRDVETIQRIYDKRVFRIFKFEGNLYVSTVEGQKIYDYDLQVRDEVFSSLNFRPNDITSYRDQIVFSTFQDGIYFYDNNLWKDTVNVEDGLISNHVINTLVYGEKLIVITVQGIQLLDKTLKVESIENLSHLDTKINGAALRGDQLIIATADGLLSYDLSIKSQSSNEVKSEIIIHHKDGLVSEFDNLNYSQNSIDVEFRVFDFTSAQSEVYFRLYPKNETWEMLEANRIQYQNLSPDTYTFQIKTNERIVDQLIFSIRPPIWSRWWFRTILILLFLSIVYALFKYRLNKIVEKNEKEFAFKLRLATAEQEALKAQMNPHFIFNALNAIQNLILGHRSDKAYKYLGDFSKLVRQVLLNSRKLETTVRTEIEFLTLYLNLEKLRFEDQIQYEINHSSDFELDQRIPSMVLQPFVENAIVHGLVSQKKLVNPKIVISFEDNEDFIFCEIIDNGIGFVKKEDQGDKNSLGLKIISERLELYDATGQSKYRINSSSEGTTIKLQLKKEDEGSNHRR